MRLACISVDLDSLSHYCRIHGLSESILDERTRGLVYDVAVPRFEELLGRVGVPATFFAVGEDLAAPGARAALHRAHRAGHEVGNHTQRHDYRLTRLSAEAQQAEVEEAEAAIEEAVGTRPLGFRAPGYAVSAPLLSTLERRGYRYDSSVFPAVPYYAGKASVMAALLLAGRPSKAMLDRPRVLWAPRRPYRPAPDEPYRQGSMALGELPIAVTPGLGFPFIGTFAAGLPRPATRLLYVSLLPRKFFNFELHAIDVLDAADGLPEPLVRARRDLRVSHALKMARLHAVFEWLAEDYSVVTLADAAARLFL